MDHTNSLPFFVENVYSRGAAEIEVWASRATIYALRKYLFNNDAWPDFTRLPNNLLPAVRFRDLVQEQTVVLKGIRFTPIQVDHRVPTFGFLIEHGSSAVLWSSDTERDYATRPRALCRVSLRLPEVLHNLFRCGSRCWAAMAGRVSVAGLPVW